MALQATTVQTQYSPFQQVILSTISTNSTYQTIERMAQKQTFTNLFSNAISALSQSSQVFNEDWALFDSHVAPLIKQEMRIDSTIENSTFISKSVQNIESLVQKPLFETRKCLEAMFPFDQVITSAELLALQYTALPRAVQQQDFSFLQRIFEITAINSQQTEALEPHLTRFSAALAKILTAELVIDPSDSNKKRLTNAVFNMESAARHYFHAVPACIQPVEIRLKHKHNFTKRENFPVVTGLQEDRVGMPRVLDLTKLKTKEAEEAISSFLGISADRAFREKITARNFAELYFFAIEHNLGSLTEILQDILQTQMRKHPTPPIDGFQWDQDFVPFVDAFLEVSKKQNISGNSHFSPFEQYLAEACLLYKMFIQSEDNIRSHITAVIQNPDQSDVSRKLIYCFLAIHIDLNKNVADIVKKYILPFLFLSDRGCDNEFIESAFEYFILCRVFGKKDATPKGELVKVVGPKSIQFTLDREDQRNQIKKAFQDFDLVSSFEQIDFISISQ